MPVQKVRNIPDDFEGGGSPAAANVVKDDGTPGQTTPGTAAPTAGAPGSDPLSAVREWLDRQKAAPGPSPELPRPIDPALFQKAQQNLMLASAVHSLTGIHNPNWYEVQHGKGPTEIDPEGDKMLQAAATMPLQQARLQYGMDEDRRKTLNEFAEKNATRENAFGIGKTHVEAQVTEQNARLTETNRHNTEMEGLTRRQVGIDPNTGQPYAKHSPEGAQPPSAQGAPYDKRLDKWMGDLRTDLSGVGRGDQRLKVQQQIFDRADRLNTLITKWNDTKGGLDKREMEEIAIGLNATLQGSNQSAQNQVAQLVPRSISGDASKLTEYLRNEPQGTNQQEFVKRMGADVQRERDLANTKMRGFQYERLPAHVQLFRAHPAEAAALLNGYGVESKVAKGRLYTKHPATGEWEEQ